MKTLKYILIALLVLAVAAFLYVKFSVSEGRPTIVKTENAELMVDKMLTALNKQAWDSLPLIKWTFRGKNHYVWDRVNNEALIQLDDLTVHLDPETVKGKAYVGINELTGEERDKAISKAWSNWCNDMFWLAAPYKIKDPGTSLNVATDEEGNKGLLVTYESGGVTPGDAYLWFLDETGMPTGYKMWVSIIPVGGVYTSWTDWTTVHGGAKIAQQHEGKVSALKIPITDIASGDSWDDLGYTSNPIKL